MGKISAAFNKHKALITYVTAGDPSLAVTEKLIYQLEKAGADIIELGIPFSDPLADGPIIQASHQRAVKKNVALGDIFRMVAKARKKTSIPICFMLSYNLVVKYGEDKFYSDCEKNGVDGVIIPDLNPDETNVLSSKFEVDKIQLVAPNSSEERIKIAAAKASGFIYLISVAGVTGKRARFSDNLAEIIARTRKYTKLPIAIGFGISTPAQAKEAAGLADGVIVGSAIVDLVAKKKFASVPKFVSALRKALDA